MHIELFPVEKTCEQGCIHCPLARKNRNLTSATEIDKEVQESFSAIENAFFVRNVRYNLHTTSALHLLPALDHPELIHMSRFETGKEIRQIGNQKNFSDGVRNVLENKKIDPKIVGFSIVPLLPVISVKDTEIINDIIKEISSWYFIKPYKSIQVTIRSNLVDPALFKMFSPALFNADKIHLKKIMHEYTSLLKWKRRAPFYNDSLYYNEYIGKTGTQKLEISNRVIQMKKTKDDPDSYYDEAMEHYMMARVAPDFAIAPKGVMLMHSSLAINNPILWMSHTDFRSTLAKEMKRIKPSFPRMIKNTIRANSIIYQLTQKNKEGVVPQEVYMNTYEEWRPKFFPYFK